MLKLKKIILVVTLLSFSALFFGFTQKPVKNEAVNKSSMTKTYTIGYTNWGQGIPILDLMEDGARYPMEVLGNKFVAVSDEFSAAKLKTDVQNFISSEVDGILFFGCIPTLIPVVSKMCERAKMPFIMYDQIPTKEMHETLLSNPYYVGSIGLLNEKIAADAAGYAAASKYKTALILGGSVGDATHDTRTNSFTKAFKASGGKVLGSGRCIDPSESTVKADDLVAAYPNAECIYTITGDYAPGALTAINNHNLDMKIISSGVDPGTVANIGEGKVQEGNDGAYLCCSVAGLVMQNYLDGHPILDNGKAPYYRMDISLHVTKDSAADYLKYCVDQFPLSDGQIRNLCYRYNSSVDYSTYQKYFSDFTLTKVSN